MKVTLKRVTTVEIEVEFKPFSEVDLMLVDQLHLKIIKDKLGSQDVIWTELPDSSTEINTAVLGQLYPTDLYKIWKSSLNNETVDCIYYALGNNRGLIFIDKADLNKLKV